MDKMPSQSSPLRYSKSASSDNSSIPTGIALFLASSAGLLCIQWYFNKYSMRETAKKVEDGGKGTAFLKENVSSSTTHVVDCRSDTVTRPTAAMYSAMASCDCGDNVYEEDNAVATLEQRMARLFEKESALFFPTTTMANLAAIMCWCDGRGSEMIVGDQSHIYIYEQQGSAFIGGVGSRVLPNKPDGSIDIDKIVSAIRITDPHFPVTQLVCLENTHTNMGGRCLPLSYVSELASRLEAVAATGKGLGRSRGGSLPKGEPEIALHMDGARIWNAAAVSGQTVAQLTRECHSVSVCMSKGLGAPLGSILVGPQSFISRARRLRKALGGGMRQIGVIAAACMVGLDDIEAGMLVRDHERAIRLGKALCALPAFNVRIEEVETNVVMVHLSDLAIQKAITPVDVVSSLKEHNILLLALYGTSFRLVMHRDLSDADIDCVISAFGTVSERLMK